MNISISKIHILMISIIIGFTLPPNLVLAEIQNSSSYGSNLFFSLTIPILVAIVGTGSGAFFVWARERRIPPPADQERIIQDIIKEWYSHNYLIKYHKIWKEIEDSNNDEKVIDKHWQKLSSKKFPDEYSSKESELELEEQIEYLRKKLRMRKGDIQRINKRINSIRNIADVEYFSSVRLVLPTIVDTAVRSTLISKGRSIAHDFKDEVYEGLFADSLNKLKILMIFYRIRENKEVCEILIRSKLNEIILNLNSIPRETTSSASEI